MSEMQKIQFNSGGDLFNFYNQSLIKNNYYRTGFHSPQADDLIQKMFDKIVSEFKKSLQNCNLTNTPIVGGFVSNAVCVVDSNCNLDIKVSHFDMLVNKPCINERLISFSKATAEGFYQVIFDSYIFWLSDSGIQTRIQIQKGDFGKNTLEPVEFLNLFQTELSGSNYRPLLGGCLAVIAGIGAGLLYAKQKSKQKELQKVSDAKQPPKQIRDPKKTS